MKIKVININKLFEEELNSNYKNELKERYNRYFTEMLEYD